jgi:hypothetical protein
LREREAMNDNEEKLISEAYDSGELKLEVPFGDLLGKLAGASDFEVSCEQEVASSTFHEQEVMALSLRDRQVFVEALLGEAEPVERLKKAGKRYSAGGN